MFFELAPHTLQVKPVRNDANLSGSKPARPPVCVKSKEQAGAVFQN